MNELKPCPFCGGEVRIREYKNVEFLVYKSDCFLVQCDGCGCGTSYELTEQSAIAAWNRRVPTNTGEETTAGAIRQSGEEGK